MTYSLPHKSILKIIELTAPQKYKEVEVDEFLEKHEILSKEESDTYLKVWTAKEVISRVTRKLPRLAISIATKYMLD